MDCRIIRYDDKMTIHRSSTEIERLFNDSELKNIFSLSGGFCCDSKEGQTVLYRESKSDYLFYASLPLKEGFIYMVEHFIASSKAEMSVKYGLLLIAEEFGFEGRDYFPLFNLLKWQSSRKGLDYLEALKAFSAPLRELVLEKRASLNEAYLFHNTFKESYDLLLKSMEVKLSFSETNKLLRSLAEYGGKSGISAAQLAAQLGQMSKEELFQAVLRLRYPLYSEVKRRFDSFLSSFKLPSGTRVIYDENFERENYRLEINFSDLKSLKSRLLKIEESLNSLEGKGEQPDYFKHSNLFKAEEGQD